MILAFPLHSGLPVDYTAFGTELKKRGTNTGHTALIIARPEDEEIAVDLDLELGTTFTRHEVKILPVENLHAMEASNRFFQTAMAYLRQYRPGRREPLNVPMVYLDPRFRPIKAKWLDELQAEYYQLGCPSVMCGPTERENPDFGGAIVIGKAYPVTSGLIDFLPPNAHWRKYLSGELINRAIFTEKLGKEPESTLIQLRPDHTLKPHKV